MSLARPSRTSDIHADLHELSQLKGDRPISFNVIAIPEALSSAQQWSERGVTTWLETLLETLSPDYRLFELRYRLPKQFSWSAMVDLGNEFVRCLNEMPSKHRLREVPIMVVSHGLGGIIAKRALSILSDNYFNPSCHGLLDRFTSLVFLGTPHPIYRKGVAAEHLDLVVSAVMKRCSKEMLVTIREEVAFAWNVSGKFDEIAYDHPIISAYETVPTKVAIGFFRSKTGILVDERFSQIGMRHETSVPSEADHYDICYVKTGSKLYENILTAAKYTVAVAQRLEKEAASTHSALRTEDWQSTIASIRALDVKDDEPNPSDAISPQLATSGSGSNVNPPRITTAQEFPVSFTPAVKLPCYMMSRYTSSSGCIGRDNVLRMLDDALLPSKAATISVRNNDLKTFAVCGMGGLGKTQIANEFATTRKNEFDAVFFVSADNESKLSEHFNQIAIQLGLADPMDSENRAVNRDKVLQWLNDPTKRTRSRASEDELASTEENATYLLIFDNADSPEILSEFWPMIGSGSILITSRNPHAKSQFYATRGIDLGPLGVDEAAELLQKSTGMHSAQDKEAARLVSTRLGGLPLALTQVAGLLDRRKLTFDEFLEFYGAMAFVKEVHRSTERNLRSSYEYMLFNVWSFEELKPDSLSLIDVCSILDPDRISEVIFTNVQDVRLADFPRTALALDNARSELLKSSLLKRYPEEKELVMHRVVQDAARSRMSAERFLEVFVSANQLLLAAWPTQHIKFSVETRHWPLCTTLLPHAESLRRIESENKALTNDANAALDFAQLMIKAAWFHCERGNYEDSVLFCETAEAVCLRHADISEPVLAELDYPYSWVCSFLHKPETKQLHSQRMVDFNVKYNDKTDKGWLGLGIALTDFSLYYVDMELYERAVAVVDEALSAYSHCSFYENKSQLPILPRIWGAWANLGLGKLDEAEQMVLPCVEWVRKDEFQWNFNALRTGAALYTLGNVRQAQGRIDESYELHCQALEYYQSTMGKTHFQTTKALMKMAEHCTRLGDLESALQHIDDALEGWSNREMFEANRARAYHRKASILEAMGNDLKAKGLFLKADKLRKTWLSTHQTMRKPRDENDYDALVPIWVC